MSYDPPSPTNWHQVGSFVSEYKDYYDKGYNDAKKGKRFKQPFEDSGHERDTTFTDELNQWYFSGYYDYDKKKEST